MKKVLVASLIVVSLLLLTSAAMADRGNRVDSCRNCEPACPVCPPEPEPTCEPIFINIPGIDCMDIDLDLPSAPCIPAVCVSDFPGICCPDVNFDFPEVNCPAECPAPAPAPCPPCPCPSDRCCC